MPLPPFYTGPAESKKADHLSETGARRQAQIVQEVWHRAGHHQVQAWAERLPCPESKSVKSIWVVKSNLINGMPPRAP